MKKIVLFLVTIIAMLNRGHAQTSGGPDVFGYVWRDNTDPNGPTYNWIDITTNPEAVLVTGLADDNVIGPFNILGSSFHYYWYDVNQFWIGSNGYIGFTNGLIASVATQGFPNIPDPAGVNNYIGAFLSDLTFLGAGNPAQCYYYQSSTGDSLVVSYINVPFWQQAAPTWTGSNTFQVILSKNDSSIVCQYQTQTGTSPGTQTVIFTTGIENNSGNIGLTHLVNTLPVAGSSVKYYYPDTTSFQVDDASTSWQDNPGNGALFLSKNGTPYDMKAEIRNSGNTSLAGFNVSSEIRTVGNVLQVRDTQAVGALVPGAIQLINFVDPFVPTNAGAYKMTTTTLLAGDATPSNDARIMEINVVDTTLSSITLAYENGVEAGLGGIGWSGGDGGIAMHFVPPFYPSAISSVEEFIVADANGFGYSMMIYDDSGLNGAPGNLLDSVYVPGGTFTTGVFTNTPLSAPIVINSGGFYVLWFMGGDGVAIGQNITPPFSFRSYEVLGGSAPGNFAIYRSVDTEDIMIRAVIDKVVSVEEIKADALFSEFYPNPAAGTTLLNFDLSKTAAKQINIKLYSMAGKLVYSDVVYSTKGQIEIQVKDLECGMYLCKLVAGDTEVNRKLTVIR